MPTFDPSRPLEAVADALSRGDGDAAIAAAAEIARNPPALLQGLDAEARAGAVHAAARLVALARGDAGPGQAYSVASALELTGLASASARGGDIWPVAAALRDEALSILDGLAARMPVPDRLDGLALATAAEMLAALAREAGSPVVESRAHDLRCRFVLVHLADEPSEVIPALNDHADCLRRLGEPAEALRRYDAILADHAGLIRSLEPADDPLDDDDMVVLEALRETYRGRAQVAPSEAVASSSAIARIDALLERAPLDPDWD